ncbi:hypothetical protein YB2330_003726 [Saitoella coloradoensis]
MVNLTNLDLIHNCDSFPNRVSQPAAYAELLESYVLFQHEGKTLGYLLPKVVEALRKLPDDWHITGSVASLASKHDTFEKRSEALKRTVEKWRDAQRFAILKGWRNELYPCYAGPKNVVFVMERSACCLFGLVTYGIHMNGYIPATDSAPLRMWVPRRSPHKQTYGGMLDNTVAGGISYPMTPYDTLVKEAEEEASLPAELVKKNAKAAGVSTYFYISCSKQGGEGGWLQPEVQYIYDMVIPEGTVPKPNDNEVESFELLTVEEVKKALATGEFKPNCALVMIDFFVRHGILTVDNEPNFIEICARLHRTLEFPLP